MNGRLAVFDVESLYDFAGAGVDAYCNRTGIFLKDREDCLQAVVAGLWRLARDRYDCERTPSFAVYARAFIPRLVIEYLRRTRVDTRYAHRYTPEKWAQILELAHGHSLSLDAPTADGDGTPLGELLGTDDGDPYRDLGTDGAGLQQGRDLDHAWSAYVIRGAARRAGALRDPRSRT